MGKKKQGGDQLAELEQMMAQLEGGEGGDMDLDAAQAMLEGITATKPKAQKKKKIKKEKLPAPFEEPIVPDDEAMELNINLEPTEEEIEAEFQKLKAEQVAKKKRKEKEKRRQERNLLRDEEGNLMLDENGQPMTLDSLADLLGD